MNTEPAYDYVPASLTSQIPLLYATEEIDDPTAWIKLFTPDSNWTWYLTYAELGISQIMPST